MKTTNRHLTLGNKPHSLSAEMNSAGGQVGGSIASNGASVKDGDSTVYTVDINNVITDATPNPGAFTQPSGGPLYDVGTVYPGTK